MLPCFGPHLSGLTCIHASEGLCRHCRLDYEHDPVAFEEFGEHPAGIRRWKETLEQIAGEALWQQRYEIGPVPLDPELPF